MSVPASHVRATADRHRRAATAGVRAVFSVAGWSAAVPPVVVTNADLEARLETTDDWITSRSGIRERRVASGGETTAGLATRAAREALTRATIGAADVDLMIVATSTPEQPMPPTASLVAAALLDDDTAPNIGGPATIDVNVACAGFPYALTTAASLLHLGVIRTALVVAAETMSRIVDPSDRTTAVLFGDGAAALVLLGGPVAAPGGVSGDGVTRSDFSPGGGLLAADLASDPEGVGLLAVVAGGAARPASFETVAAGEHFLRMDGHEVFRRAVRAVVGSVERTLADAGLAPDDVDLFVPHQANARIVDAVCGRSGIAPNRTAGNIERYGNTSAASIPLVLAEAADAGQLRDGDLVLTTGFGAGLSVGTVLFRWSTT